jgi:AraC-like DNA-binding protein
VEYINGHLSESLTVAGIAKRLNISPSLLSHAFKNEMNIAPYRYILKKRLVLAQHKIARGESATAAAIECGFGDYSGFYKQYKKTFGTSPSRTGGEFEAEKEKGVVKNERSYLRYTK